MTTQTMTVAMPQRHWRRITRHPALIEYHRLVVFVAIVNLVVFIHGRWSGVWVVEGVYDLGPITDMALINLSLGILIRQQRVVNALFWLATRIPTSWPLWIRWSAGKIFHFGGLHSSSMVIGTMWLVFLTFAMAANQFDNSALPSNLTLGFSGGMIVLMLVMIITTIGPIRARLHSRFERVHRFVGWTVLALF